MPEATGSTIRNIAAVLHIGTALLPTDLVASRAVIHLPNVRLLRGNSLGGRAAMYPAFGRAKEVSATVQPGPA